MDGRGYLITLMFNRIRGSQPSVIRQMQREVERVYATLLTRIIRNPRKIPLFGLPFWIVFPDYPVPKHAKMELRDVVLNGGAARPLQRNGKRAVGRRPPATAQWKARGRGDFATPELHHPSGHDRWGRARPVGSSSADRRQS